MSEEDKEMCDAVLADKVITVSREMYHPRRDELVDAFVLVIEALVAPKDAKMYTAQIMQEWINAAIKAKNE